jgi:hypothetical protein
MLLMQEVGSFPVAEPGVFTSSPNLKGLGFLDIQQVSALKCWATKFNPFALSVIALSELSLLETTVVVTTVRDNALIPIAAHIIGLMWNFIAGI